MIPIESTLANQELEFASFKASLENNQFTLGGNWDYDRGFFDRHLDDEARKVWLRIPFDVLLGKIDSELDSPYARIRLGAPFVLKHIYNEGNDPEGDFRTYGALFNQFQTPLDKDAEEIEPRWVEAAKRIVQEVEQTLPH
jgi:hypothetical protein